MPSTTMYYYLESDWTVIATDERMDEDTLDHKEIRLEFEDDRQAQQYLDNPLEFVIENFLVESVDRTNLYDILDGAGYEINFFERRTNVQYATRRHQINFYTGT